jgi:hypothetical protein
MSPVLTQSLHVHLQGMVSHSELAMESRLCVTSIFFTDEANRRFEGSAGYENPLATNIGSASDIEVLFPLFERRTESLIYIHSLPTGQTKPNFPSTTSEYWR